MNHLISSFIGNRRWLVRGVSAVVILFVLFCVLFSGHVSADSGDFTDIHGYERILVRPGDTLDDLAFSYAARYSHESMHEYKSKIIRINNLTSDYLYEGTYLILPICKSI